MLLDPIRTDTMKKFELLLEGHHLVVVTVKDGEDEPVPMAPFMNDHKAVMYRSEDGHEIRVIPSRIVAVKRIN